MLTRSIVIPGRRVQTTLNKTTGVISTVISAPTSYRDTLNVAQDVTNGDFITPNPHQFTKTRRAAYLGHQVQEDSTSEVRWDGVQGDPTVDFVTGTDFNTTNLYNNALGQVFEQLRSGGVGSGLNLAVDIAEARQVTRMIRQAGRVVQYIRSFHPRQWGNRWLEYQYGWKPLIQSTYSTFDAVMHRRLYSLQRVVGKSRDGFDSAKTHNDSWWIGSREVVNRMFRSRAMIIAEYDIANTAKQQLLGYTSLNPAVIAWELVPYSFVIDWFIDIGGYLQSLESALAFNTGFRKGVVIYGYKDSQSGSVSGRSGSVAQNNLRYGDFGHGSVVTSYKRRVVLGSAPFPRIPSFQANLGWQRLISAASLLSQHLRR